MRTNTYTEAGMVMPLIMNFTTPSSIDVTELVKVSYNEQEQISYEMRLVGTRCLRHSGTTRRGAHYVSHCDAKNEIDDSKSVR